MLWNDFVSFLVTAVEQRIVWYIFDKHNYYSQSYYENYP